MIQKLWVNHKLLSDFLHPFSPNSTTTLRKLARRKLMWWLVRSGEAWHCVIAQYLGCAETVPLRQRVAEVERKVAELVKTK